MAMGYFGGRANSSSQAGRKRRLASRQRAQSRRRRLLLESLEGRSLLAVWTWVGDQDANWNTDSAGDTNWSGDALPADGDTLIFAGAAPGALNNDTAAGNSYTLQFTATGYTIGGNSITLDNAGTDISDTVGGNAVNTPLTIAASAVDVAAGVHTLGGVIGGAGGLTKLGTGTLALSNANTYAGSTAVNSGTLRAQNGAAIPDASDVTVGLATLELQSSETVASFAGGAGSNLILGANTLTTTGSMAIAGVTTAGGGLTAGTAITDNNGGATNISGHQHHAPGRDGHRQRQCHRNQPRLGHGHHERRRGDSACRGQRDHPDERHRRQWRDHRDRRRCNDRNERGLHDRRRRQ